MARKSNKPTEVDGTTEGQAPAVEAEAKAPSTTFQSIRGRAIRATQKQMVADKVLGADAPKNVEILDTHRILSINGDSLWGLIAKVGEQKYLVQFAILADLTATVTYEMTDLTSASPPKAEKAPKAPKAAKGKKAAKAAAAEEAPVEESFPFPEAPAQ